MTGEIKVPGAFIFDMDGVLIDSEKYYQQVEKMVFQQLGLRITPEEHLLYKGTATDEMWKRIKERHSLELSIEELVKITGDLTIPLFREMNQIPLMPGIAGTLEWLREKGFPLALASSSFPEIIEIVLEKGQLRSFFQVVVNSRMAGASKPSPDIFILASGQMGIPPEKCVVIEDSYNGIRAAKAAGMYCIAFNGPGSDIHDQLLADLRITRFSELNLLFG